MIEFETRKIIKPIMNFIKTCPFLEEYSIDLSDIGVQRILTEVPDGSSLDYIGGTMVSTVKDLLTKNYSKRQADFNIWLLRKSTHDIQREEICNFLFNFELWVEHCQAYGLTPKLSKSKNGQVEEFMWADSGAFFSQWEGADSSLYMIQLHITYFNEYI